MPAWEQMAIISCTYPALEDLSRCDEVGAHLILQGPDSASGKGVGVVADL